MEYLLKGLLIGIIFGVPVGAVGALSIHRTITNGKIAGIISGLGSSIADCIYASIGAFGLTLISDMLLKYQTSINIIGGIIIALLGIKMFLKKEIPNVDLKENAKMNKVKMFISSFVIGITNPVAILTFLFAFSNLGISNDLNILNSSLVVIGVFLGTLFWWMLLALITNKLKNKLQEKGIKILNKVFGVILIIFSLVIFIKLI